MKKFVFVLLILIFIFSACTPATTKVAISTTSTISPTVTYTSTPNITPLPTIPTFTPTFDVSTIVTVTPAEKAECPKEVASQLLDTKTLFSKNGVFKLDEIKLLDFLNSGGNPINVISAFNNELNRSKSNMGVWQDLTGDGINELILNDGRVVYVFGCENQKYQKWLGYTNESIRLWTIQFNTSYDMNLNGMSELFIEVDAQYGASYKYISIFEWKDSEFSPLIQGEEYKPKQYFTFAEMPFSPDVSVEDVDGNGTLELILESHIQVPISGNYAHLIPWRDEIHFYIWNGSFFTLSQIKYAKPQYHFQVIQDADQIIDSKDHKEAIDLYNVVIFNNDLKPWSQAILENEIMKSFSATEGSPTSVAPEISEYPSLASYAYYRIMLLQLMQGQETEANQTYQTLQDTFGNDIYAKRYIEMATAFLKAYQVNQNMYDGCATAIQYAVEHPEILIPLGSDYHGSQSKIYNPEDICPFR